MPPVQHSMSVKCTCCAPPLLMLLSTTSLIHFAGIDTQGTLARDSPVTCVRFLHAKGKAVLAFFTLLITIQTGCNLAKEKQKLPGVIP